MPQRGCPTCGITSKTAVLWPKTTPAQVPLAPAKTPLRRPEKATGRAVVAVTTPPRAAEHVAAIRTAGCVHCGWQQACAAARWRVYGAGVGTARRASELLALATPPAKKTKNNTTSIDLGARSLDARSATRPRRRPPPARLGNRGSLPSNAVAHVACWRCVPVVPGRGGMRGVPAAHLARRMQQQLPHRARELSPCVATPGCLSPYQRDRAACGVTEGGLLPFGTL